MLAINLAQRDGLDVSLQNEIYRNYGDHLYQKGDYDTAMQQYLKAIENTQPSQVIRKVREEDCSHIIHIENMRLSSSWTPNEFRTSYRILKSSTSITWRIRIIRHFF